MPVIGILSKVLVKIRSQCASTTGNVLVTEYTDYRETVQNGD